MSSNFYDDDDDVDTDEQEPEAKPERTPSEWAELRRAKKAADKAQKELAAFKAEREFEKAGLDPDDPKVAYFRKGYDGDLTAEAIRAEAIKAGFIQEAPPEEPDTAPLNAQQRMSDIANGGMTETGSEMTASLDQAFANGGTEGMMQYLASQGVPINAVQ